MTKHCDTCRHYMPGENAMGECRANAPTADNGGRAVFPRVPSIGWCGDHEPTQKPDNRQPHKPAGPTSIPVRGTVT